MSQLKKQSRREMYLRRCCLKKLGLVAPTPAEYRLPGNVAEEVVDDIAAWIRKQSAGPTNP